jgi:putative hydrolase of HD superfamily
MHGLPAESVADHTFRVSVLAMIITDIVREEGIAVDTETVLRMSLIHDLPEALIGDMDRGATDIVGEDLKLEFENKALTKILDYLPKGLQESYGKIWKEHAAGITRESKIVKAADKLETIIQAHELTSAGYSRKFLDELLANTETWEKELPKDLQELLKEIKVK